MKNMLKLKSILLVSFLIVLNTQTSFGQWVWFPNDSTGVDSVWNIAKSNGPTAFVKVSNNYEDKVEGTGSLQLDYRVEVHDDWGGYAVRGVDYSNDNFRYDLSSGEFLSFWYKVKVPTQKSVAGQLIFEIRIQDKTGKDGNDLWGYQMDTIMETQGEWKQVILPLHDMNGIGFWSLRVGDDNKKFEPWAVSGFDFSFTFYPTSGGGTANTPIVTGTILLDKFQILGSKYEPILSFDNQTDTTYDRSRKDAFWLLEDMNWDLDAKKEYFNLSNETSDTAQGQGALKIDYSVVASQPWGGYAQIEHVFSTPVNLESFSALGFYFKNLISSSFEGQTLMRVTVYEDTTAWVSVPNLTFKEENDWKLVLLKLQKSENVNWLELKPGDEGFAKRNGNINDEFNLTHINKIIFQIAVPRKDGEPFGPDIISQGEFLLDFLTPSGYKSTDRTEPAAPTELFAYTDNYKNIILWKDIPGETGETYTVYYSKSPIYEVDNPYVFTLAPSVSRGVQEAKHFLNVPFVCRATEFYYAIQAIDEAGNKGNILGLMSPTVNEGKITPTVSAIAPTDFAADGKLDDWEKIKPWVLKTSDESGHKVGWAVHDGDNDLWYKTWVATANDSLYVAYQVHDDFVFTDSTKETWNQDAADLYFSLYPYRGKDHRTYSRGESPDYHFRFNKNAVYDESVYSVKPVVIDYPGKNYFWSENDSGYVIEYVISLGEIASLHPGDVKFIPHYNMQMALEIAVMDADANNERQGIVTWSQLDEDGAYRDVTQWAYTWLLPPDYWACGDVEDNTSNPTDFTIDQNYPNPFNPETKISFNLKSATHVTIKVYNVLGAEITTLIDDFQTPGKHTLSFNAVNLASGIYFFRMNAGGVSTSRKMMLVK